jgi:hypothetical protein
MNEELCHRNMAFTLYHASQMPRLRIAEVRAEPLGNAVYEIWVTVENSRLIPSRTEQEVINHISPPDILTLVGPAVKVLAAGRVTDRFFKRVEPVKRRPERVEISAIPGLGAVRVQFIVTGEGGYKLILDSAHGGIFASEQRIP